MPSYHPPLRDMQFVIHELLGAVDELNKIPAYSDLDADTVNAVLEEGGKFASEVLTPLNLVGDEQGCVLDKTTHEVKTPDGFKDAYKQYTENGWSALSAAPEWGGQGLPLLINQAIYEMLNSANQAWTMYPGLSHGAHACLEAHGSDEQKKTYLPKLTSGEWTGTMCLTEPHCGTDLGLLRTKAEPQADGTYKITGAKIFISAGEHKMGIHGNATAQMVLDNAVGTLVGQPHRGLPAMFVMMNGARLGVGNQSLGLTQVAYENAVNYAKDRVQMRALSGPKRPDLAADPIIVHPDVRKMLLTARAYAEGARALVYFVAVELDKSHNHPDEAVRKESDDTVALLTPIVKAFITDNAWEATMHCQQVYGGHGFIHEWGMEQFVRDARINMIYEGTNTIQSLDLLGRKVLGDGGAKLTKFGKLVSGFVKANADNEALKEFTVPLAELGKKVQAFTMEVGMKGMQNPDEVGAAAVDYMRVVGHLVYAFFFAQSAKIALEKQSSGDKFYVAKLATARFYFAKLLPQVETAMITAKAGLKPLMEMDEALF
jgi:alkylation response protein AidB-like acyl-CoA dehydrogenase